MKVEFYSKKYEVIVMEKFTKEELIKMCRPHKGIYRGLDQDTKKRLQTKYKECKNKLEKNTSINISINYSMSIFLDKLDENNIDFFGYVEKSYIMDIILTEQYPLYPKQYMN